MKLVGTKCPNCGSAIKVNPSDKMVKCAFCDSDIIVEEAIDNVSEVVVKNLPKVENYIKIGQRNFNNEDYKEALVNYQKAEELDPDNHYTVLRIGQCKSLLTWGINIDFKPLLKAVKDAFALIDASDNDDIKREFILFEANKTISIMINRLRNDFLSKKNNLNDVIRYCNSLIAGITSLEKLKDYPQTDKTKRAILSNIIGYIDKLLEPILYSEYVGDVLRQKKYYYKDTIYKKKRMSYQYELNMMDPEFAENERIRNEKEMERRSELNRISQENARKRIERNNKIKDWFVGIFIESSIARIISLVFSIILFLVAFLVIISGVDQFASRIVFALLVLVWGVSFLPKTYDYVINKFSQGKIFVVIFRFFYPIGALFIFAIFLAIITPYEYCGEWNGSNGSKLVIDNEKIEYKIDDKVISSDYQKIDKDSKIKLYDDVRECYDLQFKDEDGNKYFIRYFVYETDNKKTFCLIEDDKCKIYFTPVDEEKAEDYIEVKYANK